MSWGGYCGRLRAGKLQKSISPGQKRRMQGKSCFNFRNTDDALFKELAALTEAAARLYTEKLNVSLSFGSSGMRIKVRRLSS